MRSRSLEAALGATSEGAPVASVTAIGAERKCLKRLAELVTRELGIRMPESKLSMLESRLLRRIHLLQLNSFEAYEAYLKEAGVHGERRHFYDAVTTNKTDFFREPRHFEYLSGQALPALTRQHAKADRWHCRVWCAGCSSGQEVYTLAMVLSEYQRAHPGFTFSITATDISTRVLEQAARAIYPEEEAEPIPMPLRKQYLLRSKRADRRLIRIVPELRERVQFARLNFMDERYAISGRFDVIFFRNVMIYFDKPTQERVIGRQCKLLASQGYFFISHTESLAGLNVPLQSVSNAVFRKSP